MHNLNELIGTHDILLVTLDTLRYDVAQNCWSKGRTPNLSSVLSRSGWEKRHSPATFTYAAHHAFFAGFLPTPVAPGKHPRLLATTFPGSETTTEATCILDAPDIVTGLAERGYHTVCIGGVGFFNKLSPLGCVLPALFKESHWSRELGVTDPNSTANQVALATSILKAQSPGQRIFLFINISAIHQPNRFYLNGATEDSLHSHAAALEYVDSQLGSLFRTLQQRGQTFGIICSDHGTAYGEDNYHGHRLAHPVVWEVPYTDFILPQTS
jgi:Sulfatase